MNIVKDSIYNLTYHCDLTEENGESLDAILDYIAWLEEKIIQHENDGGHKVTSKNLQQEFERNDYNERL